MPALGRQLDLARGVAVLDLIYVAATIALFAIVALVAKGVEKL